MTNDRQLTVVVGLYRLSLAQQTDCFACLARMRRLASYRVDQEAVVDDNSCAYIDQCQPLLLLYLPFKK